MKKHLKWLVLAGGILLGNECVQAQHISQELANVDALSKVRVIIQWKTPLDQEKADKVLQLGGALQLHHPSIKASTYTIPAAALGILANDPDVAYISTDRPVKSKLDYSAAAVNAPMLWGLGYTGKGIGVAVIDSGMRSSPDLTANNNIVYNQDFTGLVKPNANLTDTNNAPDLYGHGQHVAGIIASSGRSSSCGNCTKLLKGIAPGVNLINLRVLDQTGTGSDSMVIAAIEQAITLKATYNIRVINLSIGRPVYESYTQDPLCQAVEQAWKAGIVVVVAAGNDGRDNSYGNQGYGTISAPANDPYVITVGAMKTEETDTRTDDLVASYSSKGPTQVDHIVKPDLVAPGNQVVSLLAAPNATLVAGNPANNVPVSYYQNGPNAPSNAYLKLSGTSMATPVVSAGVADLLQAQPNLTPDQVKALLMQTAYKTFPASSTVTDPTSGLSYVSYYDVFTVGAGYLDLQAALQGINSVPAGLSAQSPVAQYNGVTGVVTLSPASSTLWAAQAAWNLQTVWGSRSVWGAQAIWNSRSVWGAASVSSSSSLAASNSVWGARSCWGASSTASESTDSSEAVNVAIQGEP